MNRALRFWHVIMVVLLLPILLSTLAYATGDVTFQVNMKNQMKENKFLPGSGDIVYVTGDFNGWVATANPLSDGNADSIYTGTVTGMTEAGINYKFYKTLRGGLDWENDISNRTYTVVAGPQTIPAPWFDNDSIYVAPVLQAVTFQVNMRVKILEQTFRPDLGDVVSVPGSMNGWSTGAEPLTKLAAPNDSIYARTDSIAQGSSIAYKFYKTTRGGLDWENNPNRPYTVPFAPSTIPVVWFDNDSVVNVPINANILFTVNMNPYEDLGFFRPDLNDSIEIRGAFNGWAGGVGALMTEDPFHPGVYQITVPYSGTSFDQVQYKYRMKFDSAGAVVRFPGYATDQDNVAYDHPAERGDGNRILDVGFGGNIIVPTEYFSSIGPCGEVPAGDTVTVTAQVNMGPASRNVIPFTIGTDSVWVFYQDHFSRDVQAKTQGSFSGQFLMTQPHGDSIYTATWTFVGPAHYFLMYSYQFKQAGPSGGTVTEGGGLGGQDLYRSRFIPRVNYNHSVRNYTMPVDNWKAAAPYTEETPPCAQQAYAMCDGWNMVSVPITVSDYHKAAIFTNASSSLFAYNNGYVPTDPASNGPGFWAKFAGAQNNFMTGLPITAIDIPVAQNWNMIGSISTSVPTSSVTSTAPGIVISPYFGYNCGTGYFPASSIDPGNSYWVRTSAAGTLHLIAPASNKVVAAVDETKKLNKITIQDQAGHRQVLYFGAAGVVDESRFEMPPSPPAGSYDVRFASNQMLAVVGNSESKSFPIIVSSAAKTVKISWELTSASISASLFSGTKEVPLKRNGSTTLSSSNLKLVLMGSKNDGLLPKVYALQQNYPNPFNPTTSIQYQLPFDSRVIVKIYDIMGKEVRSLIDDNQEAGFKSIEWNSTNNSGNVVASGVYFYRITATNMAEPSKIFVDTKKMMLLK